MATLNPDPSPEQIAAACLEIQATWSDRERLTRLRVDLRPMYRRADGEMEQISADDYVSHLEHHERLQADG